MKKTLFILLATIFSFNIYAQVSKVFWFAMPRAAEHSGGDENKAITLRFVTFNKPATITITTPADPSILNETRTLPANSDWVFVVDKTSGLRGKLETYPQQSNRVVAAQDAVEDKGIKITSTELITAYYANVANNSEIYSLKGENALGLDFLVPSQYKLNNGTTYDGGTPKKFDKSKGNSIEMVATENNTKVTITLPNHAGAQGGHAAGSTFSVNLNQGQTFTLCAVDNTAANHLYNTRIKSDKPIAVNYTDDSVFDADLIGEQLVPLKYVGNEYIAVKNKKPGNFNDLYIFPADTLSQAGTQVKIQYFDIGGTLITENSPVMNVGDKYNFPWPATGAEVLYITSNKQIQVLQVTSIGHESGATILPNITCTGSYETAYKPVGNSYDISLVTKTANIEGFLINNNPFAIQPTSFKPVPGTNGEWSFANVNPIASDGIIRVTNSMGHFHMGVFNTIGSSFTYGYFSNYNPLPLNPQSGKQYYIVGEDVHVKLPGADDLQNFKWYGPNDPTKLRSTQSELIINNVQESDGGMYVVSADSKKGCDVEPYTFLLSVFKPERNDTSICMGNSVMLTASGYPPYKWTPGVSTDGIAIVSPKTETIYTVANYKPAGQNLIQNGDFENGNVDFTSKYIYGGTGNTALSTTSKYAVGSTPQAYNPGFSDLPDRNNSGGDYFIANCRSGEEVLWEQTIKNIDPKVNYILSGWFTTAVIDGRPAKLRLKINGSSSNLITPSNDGEWQRFSYSWNSGNEGSAIIRIITDTSNSAGATVCIDDLLFSPTFLITDTFVVAVRDSLHPIIAGDPNICFGVANLSVDETLETYDTYLWSNGETTREVTLTEPGDYSVRVTSADCKGTAFITVLDAPEFSINIEPTNEACSGETVLEVPYTIQAGEVGAYSITFDDQAKAAGFVDVVNQSHNAVSGQFFPISLPKDVAPGFYTAKLEAFSKAGCGISQDLPIEVLIKVDPEKLMAQKWNNVLALFNKDHNGGYEFIEFQWYKNGEPLLGETNSILYLGSETQFYTDDKYSARLTDINGAILYTCDFVPTERQGVNTPPTVYEVSSHVQLQDLPLSGTVKIWDISSGQLHLTKKIENTDTEISLPDKQGFYLFQIITTNGENIRYKIFVK